MARYFIEVLYKGTGYAGFQAQDNANTIQAEIEKALKIYFKEDLALTGSSRTDAGVHALQNYFHTDYIEIESWDKHVYHLNAILPPGIVIKRIFPVRADAHCRFDALYRTYEYRLYTAKDPFMEDRAYFYPYTMDMALLNEAAGIVMEYTDFESFSKRNTQVRTFACTIRESRWEARNGMLIFRVSANRFLRGMVRGLTGTMLKVGRGKLSIEEFRQIIVSHDQSLVDFSVPAHGLTLMEVAFDDTGSK